MSGRCQFPGCAGPGEYVVSIHADIDHDAAMIAVAQRRFGLCAVHLDQVEIYATGCARPRANAERATIRTIFRQPNFCVWSFKIKI